MCAGDMAHQHAIYVVPWYAAVGHNLYELLLSEKLQLQGTTNTRLTAMSEVITQKAVRALLVELQKHREGTATSSNRRRLTSSGDTGSTGVGMALLRPLLPRPQWTSTAKQLVSLP